MLLHYLVKFEEPKNIKNPRWRTAAILKIVKSPYLSEKLFDFDEIWYTTAYIEPGVSHVTKKIKFLKFSSAILLGMT